MISALLTPYSLTDKGFIFELHDPQVSAYPEEWQQMLSNPDHLYDSLAFAVDRLKSVYILQFSGLLTISVSLVTKTINLWPEISLSPEALQHILIDQLVPRINAAQGALTIHAGAVVDGVKAVVFVGESGAGKSTLVASLIAQGLKLLNDDAVVVSNKSDQFFVSASHNRLRLFPDSLTQVFANEFESAAVSELTSKKRVVQSDRKRHENSDFPLGAIFLIGNQSAKEISLRQLAPVEAVMAIVANSFALNPTEPDFAVANLRRASALAAQVPAYELNYPRSYEALPDVHQAIFNKLRELQA